MSHNYAPGVRVEIRDAEWRIKCVDRTSDGGELLTCEGLSELVRGREATFLSKIESSIRVLAPEDTVLVDQCTGNWYYHLHSSKGFLSLAHTARKTNISYSYS